MAVPGVAARLQSGIELSDQDTAIATGMALKPKGAALFLIFRRA
jgi:hypothetical protein